MPHPPRLPHFDHERGTGPTLIFLHYWGGSAGTWQHVTSLLHGRDMITLDFRGWGRSRELPGPYSLQQSAADALALIAEAGLTGYVLVGHSMGGKVAQLVAARRPVGLLGIVLAGSAPARPPATITPEYQEALSHAYDTTASIAASRDDILTASDLPDDVKAQILADSAASSEAARLEWPRHGIAEDIAAQSRLIDVPALVVAGENDGVEPTEVLRENLLPHLPNAELEVIRGSGHLMPLEAPSELARLVAGFVTRLDQPSG